MRVLGIDPGSLVTGWGLIVGPPTEPRLVECGVILLPAAQPLARRLARLEVELRRIVDRLAPNAAAVEAPFHGASARSALQLAHARGVVLCVLAATGLDVAEYSPATVKKTVTGSGRADKEQVGAIVGQTLGPLDASTRHDATDALAVALCHLATERFAAATRGERTS